MLSFKNYNKKEIKFRPMTSSEWLKYDWRIDKLISKLENREPFLMIDGKKVLIGTDLSDKEMESVVKKINSKDGKTLNSLRFVGNDGSATEKIYRLSHIGKTEEFGGGTKGSGAGSDMTSLTESAQCLYCAAAWNNYGFDEEGLRKAEKHVDITETADKIISDLPDDWKSSCMSVAENLKKMFKGSGYVFHRGSKWVENLEKRFKVLNKIEREFSNLNKWSPADIYIVKSDSLNENFSQANSLVELNAVILKNLQNGNIIPVSLKKTNSDKIEIKYVNFDEENKSTYEIGKPYYTTGKKDFFSSKDVYMNFIAGEIQYRGFNPIDFQGEIKGKYAAHGKVGHSIIKKYVRSLTNNDLSNPRDVAKSYKNDKEKLYKSFYEYYKAIEENPLSYIEFVNNSSKKDLGWHVSKYIGTQMIYFIHNSKKNTLDAFIGYLIGYAASESEMSASHVKVM